MLNMIASTNKSNFLSPYLFYFSTISRPREVVIKPVSSLEHHQYLRLHG